MNIPLENISFEWCLGKPCGFITKKEKTVYWKTSAKGKQISKSFAISNYDDSIEKAELAAREYGKKWSDEHGYTKNQVRKLPDNIYWNDNPKNYPLTNNTIEVKIDEHNTMLIDHDDLHIIECFSICKTKSGSNKNAKYYAAISFKGTREDKKNGKKSLQQFHNYLTGYDMVDHNNRNPMDNRRCNLAKTTKKENNNNRTCECTGMKYAPSELEKVPGVRFVYDRPGGAWQARIKQNEKEKTVSFSVNKYGDSEACRLAVEARKTLNEQFNCKNST
jgi:hypothetical protein